MDAVSAYPPELLKEYERLAQISYDAYRQRMLKGNSYWKTWEELPLRFRQGWIAATCTMIRELAPKSTMHPCGHPLGAMYTCPNCNQCGACTKECSDVKRLQL